MCVLAIYNEIHYSIQVNIEYFYKKAIFDIIYRYKKIITKPK